MSSIFSKIISGEIPCYKIAEDDYTIAFLDVNPVKKGHCLVVPKIEVDKFYELSPTEYTRLFAFAQNIAKAIEKSFDCKRVGMSIIGLEVPHTHIHLIPINLLDDMIFTNPREKLSNDEFHDIATLIKSNL